MHSICDASDSLFSTLTVLFLKKLYYGLINEKPLLSNEQHTNFWENLNNFNIIFLQHETDFELDEKLIIRWNRYKKYTRQKRHIDVISVSNWTMRRKICINSKSILILFQFLMLSLWLKFRTRTHFFPITITKKIKRNQFLTPFEVSWKGDFFDRFLFI